VSLRNCSGSDDAGSWTTFGEDRGRRARRARRRSRIRQSRIRLASRPGCGQVVRGTRFAYFTDLEASMATTAKQADLAGPGIGNYDELERILPADYQPLLDPLETMRALYGAKRLIEDRLCEELNLNLVQVPLIVDSASGVNDYLDRDGSRTPIQFHIANDDELHPIDAEVVQAATKWKRMALRQFGLGPGEGLLTDMRAVRKDYFLDHDHSAYVDQWDWERVVTPEERRLDFLTDVVRAIWNVLKEAELYVHERHPRLADAYEPLPDDLTFIHAEDILEAYPDLPRKERETAILQDYPAIFIYGIGWELADGYPHELRAADYDDWSTETLSADGRPMHGLNGDILVWNPVTRRRHELTSMGIRVTKEGLRRQLELSGQLDFLELPYHRAIMEDEIPLSIGGGIGQSRTMMLLLRKAHLGEVSVTVWPQVLKEMCAGRNIHVLE
jgi:aspartate--ammonia ligase